MRNGWVVVGFSAVLSTALFARGAGYGHDVGFTRLEDEQQSATPTGAGVPVTQVEAPATNSPTADDYFPTLTESDGTTPDPNFTGKTITPETTPYSDSGHAATVGGIFYGNNASITPGITSINVFNANNWIGDEFLNTTSSSLPFSTTDRVANHSYIGFDTLADNKTFDPAGTLDSLHRLDYVVQNDDFINVVAENNPNNGGAQPLLADSFNAISVGLTNGMAASGTTGNLNDPQGLYIGGRAAPDVVAPMGETSYATPIVASTAAILVEYAHANAAALNETSFVSPRTGQTLYSGETDDVIKAAIMAGADRVTANQSTSDQVSDYADPTYKTSNGLDTRYGAGQVDVYNSYHIIAAGQQAPGAINTYGFDFNASSPDDPNTTEKEDYTFTGQYGVAATLAWKIHIAATVDGTDNAAFSASLAHFQLHLYQLTSTGEVLIAQSVSTIDNTQNIYVNGLQAADTYELEVTRSDGLGGWDYGLAWDLAPAPEPSAAVALLSGFAVMAMRRNPKTEIRNPKKIPNP